MSRIENIHTLTRRLIVMTVITIAIFAGIFGITLVFGQRFMLTWIAFICGIIGGFVSIQQRMKNISDAEVELLSKSWFQVLLVPVFGGIFALVLYAAFLSEVVSGHMFPEFYMPPPLATGPDTEFMKALFSLTYPKTGPDLAKFLFWSFVAGFSERLVPQIITKAASEPGSGASRQ